MASQLRQVLVSTKQACEAVCGVTYGGLVKELDGDADGGSHDRGVVGVLGLGREGRSLCREYMGVSSSTKGVVKQLVVGTLSLYERALQSTAVWLVRRHQPRMLAPRHRERDSLRTAADMDYHHVRYK
jgi:hypothetical protein